MKFSVDPLPAMKASAVDVVNSHFNALAINNAHRDAAHAQKRVWAVSDTSKLAAEASLRGITIEALAAFIASKPDAVAVREQARQAILLKIDAAKTPDDLTAATATIGN